MRSLATFALLLLAACDPLARVEPARERPASVDVGPTLPNDPLAPDTDVLVDTGDGTDPGDEAIEALAVGSRHTCVLYEGGRLRCWGADEQGQADAPSHAFTQVSAGSAHTCGLGTDGAITCWGVDVPGAHTPPAGAFVDVAAGPRISCAVGADGAVACWGDEQTPAGVPASRAIAVGLTFACTITQDDRVFCFGSGPALTGLPGGDGWEAISAGEAHACALDDAGGIACWGDGAQGQTTVPEGTWRAVAAGGASTCGVTVGGEVRCWGEAPAGLEPPTGSGFTDVAVGPTHACARNGDRDLVCWGQDAWFQSLTGIDDAVSVVAGTSFACVLRAGDRLTCIGEADGGTADDPPPGAWLEVAAHLRHACGLKTDGSIACWGTELKGQLTVPAGPWSHVGVTQNESCGIRGGTGKEAGDLVCWGGDYPFEQPGSHVAVDGGTFHGCALLEDGKSWCWGQATAAPQANSMFSEVAGGLGTTCGIEPDASLACFPQEANPLNPPPQGGPWTRVAVGDTHACAIDAGREVTCWGPEGGALDAPGVQLLDVAVGADFACGVEASGRLTCWGSRKL